MTEYSTKSEMTAVAIAGGITQEQIDHLLKAFPFMEKESWWISNASSGPVRAVKYQLEVLNRNNRKQAEEAMAAKYSDAEVQRAARDHRAGKCVDSELVFQAHQRGFLSQSDAMNSDF